MDYILPNSQGYTIYSKSGCPFCTKVKRLLEKEAPSPLLVDCDDYLVENKEAFLVFIKEMAGKEYKTFPMIFHNGDFIGGFSETKEYYEKQSAFQGI
jgi:glutaredoxin-related protein